MSDGVCPPEGGRPAGRPLRIAYVAKDDPENPNDWSGSIYGMLSCLRLSGAEVTPIGHIREPRLARYVTALKKLFYARVLKTEYNRLRDPALVRGLCAAVDRELAGRDFDLVVFPTTVMIPFLKTDLPVVAWTDAVFDGMVGFYPIFSRLCRESRAHGSALEQKAMDRATCLLFASDWAAATARRHYGLPPEKSRVVRLSANIPSRPDRAGLEEIVDRRLADGKVRLLLIGREWERKGGPKALAVVEELRRRSIDAELHLVACAPPGDPPPHVVCHGYLPKHEPEGWRRFRQLFEQCRFHILPSESECYGLVLIEAAAFGLPSVSSDVGGMTSAMIEGETGYAFAAGASARDYADRLMPLITDGAAYRDQCIRAFEAYESRLTWDVSAREIGAILRGLVPGQAAEAARGQ